MEKWLDFREAMARKLLTHAEDLNFEDAGAVRGFVVSHRLPPVAPPSKRLLKDWPKDLPALDMKTVAHILYGYRRGSGHLHGYGWVGGDDEFPASATPHDVVNLLEVALRHGAMDINVWGEYTYRYVANATMYIAHTTKHGTRVKTFYRATRGK